MIEQAEGPRLAGTAQPADDLIRMLTRVLPELADEVMTRDADIRTAVEKSELDPQEVNSHLMARADEVLRFTNREIAVLRDARSSRENHEFSPSLGAGLNARRSLASRWSYARVGAGLWIMLAWPVVVWQVWAPLSTALGGVWSALILGAGFIVTPLIAVAFFVAPRGVEERSDVAMYACFQAAGMDLLVGYGLLVWRLWGPTVRAAGSGWAWLIWLAAAVLLVGLGTFLLFGVLAVDTPEEVPNRLRKPAPSFLVAAIAGLATWWLSARFLFPGQHHVDLDTHLPAVLAAGVTLAAALTMPFILGAGRVVLRTMLGALSRNVDLPGSRGWSRRLRELAQAVNDADHGWREAAKDAIRPLLREQIQLMSVPPFSTTRETINPRGLYHMRSADDVIETQAFDRLRRLVDTLSGGAVGMAGPRGAGKSTLLEYYRSGRLAAVGTEQLTLMENVPVQYDPREYALYLYSALCEKVIGFRGHSADSNSRAARQSSASWRVQPRSLLFLAWAAVGYIVLVSALGPDLSLSWVHRIWWFPVAAIGLGAVTIFVGRGPRIKPDLDVSSEGVHDLASLQEYAGRKLRSLRYQLSRTSGWSGTLSLPLGAQGTGSTMLELSAQPMTYPEVVSDFRAFLECAVAVLRDEPDVSPVPVVIILDELDKIASAERVQDFLNEAKALFALDKPGCLFLVSVSEDALAHFERRGLPIRDAFDSTFDTILRVDYLGLADATRIVRSRVVRLSAPFICLGYCLSGGLPRELIRYTREIVNGPERDLAEVCARIIGQELRNKASALETVVARNVNAEPFASDLMSFANAHTVPSARDLLDALSKPPVPPGLPVTPTGESLTQLIRLQGEALSHLYYCVTLIEVFSALTEAEFASGMQKTGEGSFDSLAAARRQFSVNARLAWMTISRFRAQWNLTPLDPPAAGR
jgi:hypothetical protein